MIFNLYIGFETRVGSIDIKSSPVHFYVQRASDFSTTNTIIPFEIERVNIGGAMNLTSGVFTAPRSGIYFFSLSGLKGSAPNSLFISLRLNGKDVGSAFAAAMDYDLTYSIQATLHLQTGDVITLYKTGGVLSDNVYHYTHYTGWLLEEDLF